ncbi:MAG: hypothetical protein AB1486_11570 [Planctomycetota bacterium]
MVKKNGLEALAALRGELQRLQAESRELILSTTDVVVSVTTPEDPCPHCGARMLVQKSVIHRVVTLAHGRFLAKETVRVCQNACRYPSGQRVTRRADGLSRLVQAGSVNGYDLEVHIGLERFLHQRQREELRASLQDECGIALSSGEVSILSFRFLEHLGALHGRRAKALRSGLVAAGGYPLHIDATGKDGRGTLFVAYAGWQRWVLGAWKLCSERADQILPRLQQVCQAYGVPCAILRDLGRAVIQATHDLVATLDPKIPILSCHLHFLQDVGRDLQELAYDELRRLFRRTGVRARLRALARDLGRQLGPQLVDLRREVARWAARPNQHALPAGATGCAVVRALAQWALDAQTQGQHLGFPFDRPYLALYQRCRTVRRALDAFLRHCPKDRSLQRAMQRMARLLEPVVSLAPFQEAAHRLQERAQLFDELRKTLRLKPPGSQESAGNAPTPTPTAAELRDIRGALTRLTSSLRKRRPRRGPAQSLRQGIDLILDHLRRHGHSLWGHVIRLPRNAGGGTRIVERTNNLLEGFFNRLKHGERRRSGRKTLTHDLECLPAEVALAHNLTRPDYVQILCGSLENLPQAFAQLDCDHRAKIRAARATTRRLEQIAPQIVTTSLPTADRGIVRSSELRARIEAAAQSRAPRQAISKRPHPTEF